MAVKVDNDEINAASLAPKASGLGAASVDLRDAADKNNYSKGIGEFQSSRHGLVANRKIHPVCLLHF